MNILLLDVAMFSMIQTLLDEGNKITYLCPSEILNEVKNVFGEKINIIDQNKLNTNYDIVISCGVEKKVLPIVDKFKKTGIPVIGAGTRMAAIELNRKLGKQVIEKFGIQVPRYTELKAKNIPTYIKERKIPQVLKPNDNKAVYYTIVPNTIEDSIHGAEIIIKDIGPETPVEVEDFIDGIEVGIETFMGKENFIYPINVSFEHKKTNDFNLGRLSGESGTSMYYEDNPKLFQQTLGKLRDFLIKMSYIGDICTGLIVNEKGIYFLEFTVRFGIPEIIMQLKAMPSSGLTKFFIDLFRPGTQYVNIEDIFLNGIRYYNPGAPYKESYQKRGYGEIITYKKKPITLEQTYELNRQNIGFFDFDVENNQIITPGSVASVCTIGKGITLTEAILNSYKEACNISINGGFYRTDIGFDLVNYQAGELYNLGYIPADKYKRMHNPDLNIRKFLNSVKRGEEWLI